MISIPAVVRNWSIKTPEVFRYLDQEYIDEFFSNGRIRLSTFIQFKKNPDEQLGDSTEGRNVLFGSDGEKTIVALTQHGINSYVLCSSTEENLDLVKTFNTSGYFKIRNTTGFAVAIANRMAGYIDGYEG